MALKEVEGEEFPSFEETPKIIPFLQLGEKDLPEVKSWDVGENYMILLDVRMKDVFENEDGTISGVFRVERVGTLDDVTDKQMEKMIARARTENE